MRTLLALVAGIALGILVTLAAVELSGGWWVYELRPTAICQPSGGVTRNLGSAHVAPNQPNPCLFREPRWSFIR